MTHLYRPIYPQWRMYRSHILAKNISQIRDASPKQVMMMLPIKTSKIKVSRGVDVLLRLTIKPTAWSAKVSLILGKLSNGLMYLGTRLKRWYWLMHPTKKCKLNQIPKDFCRGNSDPLSAEVVVKLSYVCLHT